MKVSERVSLPLGLDGKIRAMRGRQQNLNERLVLGSSPVSANVRNEGGGVGLGQRPVVHNQSLDELAGTCRIQTERG
ncbi:MAG: hypothetical protein ACOYLK_07250, partial [Sphingomonas sp.]